MDDPIAIALLVIAASAWCVAVFSALALVSKRRADISFMRLWFDGMRWFKRDTFRPEAAATWRLFIWGWVVFIACVIAVALYTIVRTLPAA